MHCVFLFALVFYGHLRLRCCLSYYCHCRGQRLSWTSPFHVKFSHKFRPTISSLSSFRSRLLQIACAHTFACTQCVCMYVTCFLNGLSFVGNCHSAEQLSMQTDQQVRARSQLGKMPRDVLRTFHKGSISMYRRTCRVFRRVANWLFDASILYLTINARIINVLPTTPQNPEINTSSIIVTTANTQSPTHTHTELHSHNKIKSSAVKYKNCLLIGHVPACAAA